MSTIAFARGYAGLIGVVLVAVGLLGFTDNPIVGGASALFHTGTNHNLVHVATGLLALFVAFGLRGSTLANGVIAFGVLYAAVFVVLLVSPTLFGLLDEVNVADHVLHAGLGLVSIAVGVMARTEQTVTAS